MNTDLFPTWDKRAEQQHAEHERLTIEAERLTAEFSSPLNSANRQIRLKRTKGNATLWQEPEQQGLFAGAPSIS